MPDRFGDDAYAVEEFVAELGGAFFCADFGITLEPRPNHAPYIDTWLNVLKATEITRPQLRRPHFAANGTVGTKLSFGHHPNAGSLCTIPDDNAALAKTESRPSALVGATIKIGWEAASPQLG